MANVGGVAEGAVFVARVADFDEALHVGRILRRIESSARRVIDAGSKFTNVASGSHPRGVVVWSAAMTWRRAVKALRENHYNWVWRGE